MDRFDVINFADLTGPDGGEWVKIGGGSFGVVFKGEYLGTQVAIKEVLPNTTYDVEKYFERECVLMKEARHPNIVQYIGLTKSPGPDGRIYIISEFVGGNLRSYIADTRKPFPWRLRISFAMDIARALAYLHARNCLHRDLKGENLLITANDRIKVCDFGFARIAARNEDEMRRISYCGTDGYMSPEILLGVDFSLPSDIFSLGVIFAEIASRHLVDPNTFKRTMPSFGLDADEVREMASDGCPSDFIQLALDCVEEDPCDRPEMRQVVARLRDIEREVMMRAEKDAMSNIGSIRGSSIHALLGSKAKKARPAAPPRLPSFNGEIKVGRETPSRSGSEDSSGDEIEEALAALERIGIDPDDPKADGTIKAGSTFKVSGHGNPWWSDEQDDSLPSINASWIPAAQPSRHRGESEDALLEQANESDYSTSVVRSSKINQRHASLSCFSNTESTMTVKGAPCRPEGEETPTGMESVMQSFMTAHTHRADLSLALATIASADSSLLDPPPLHHRFTLVKNGTRRPASITMTAQAAAGGFPSAGSLLPPAVMLSNALAKCWVCSKRIGWKPFMDCDDCPYKTHIACAELAPPTCQDLHIPAIGSSNGGGSGIGAILSPLNASRRNSKVSGLLDPKAVSAAAAALKAATAGGGDAGDVTPPERSSSITNGKKDKSKKKRFSLTPPPQKGVKAA
ncbi:kinase-like protein [Violaceomyces palustris]|uniref:Kinase-like protein n=1 Tax=Violaceomyces palustris TaxID=1673888 RepID=A0ACD0NS55_9BASI|nr:kinase-like protein [Violaceomyces palustris]